MISMFHSGLVNRDRPVLTKMQDAAHPHRPSLAGKTTARTKLVQQLLHKLTTKEVPHDRQRL